MFKYYYLYVELTTFLLIRLNKSYKLIMDKQHLIDLITDSMIFENCILESYKNKFKTKNYLNNRDLNQLRIISKEFIL